MKVLFSLIKVQLSAFLTIFTGRKKQRSRGKTIGFIIVWLYIAAAFVSMFAFIFLGLAEAYLPLGFDWLYFTIYGMMAFALMFIGSVFIAKTQLFEAKDNELLLSMPIPPSYIVASRIISLFIIDLVYELCVAVPAFVCFCIFGSVTAAKVFAFVVMLVVLPLLCIGITALFAALLSALLSRVKRKNIVTMVFSIAFLVLYFIAYSRMQSYMEYLITEVENISNNLGAVFFLYWFGTAIGNGNLLNLLLAVIFSLAVFALVWYIVSATFIKIATTNKGAAKKVYVASKSKNKGADSALLRRELTRFASSPGYMLNCGIGLFFMLAVPVIMIIRKAFLVEMFTELRFDLSMFAPLAGVTICLMQAFTAISAPSVSLEGNTLWIAQSLPVGGSRVLLAKVKMHFLVAAPFSLVASAAIAVIFPSGILGTVAVILAPLCMCAFEATLGVTVNMKNHRFDWLNETEVIKRGAAMIITLGISFGVVIIPAVLYFTLLRLFISLNVFMLIFSAALAVAAAVMYGNIKNNGDARFAALGN